jgi:hypothetical protein
MTPTQTSPKGSMASRYGDLIKELLSPFPSKATAETKRE